MTEEQRQFPKPIEAFVVIISSFIFILLVTQSILLLVSQNPEQLDTTSSNMKLLITFGEAGLIIIPLLYIKRKKYPITRVFRWKKIPLRMIIWSMVIGLSITIIGDELDRIISIIIPAPDFLAEMAEAMRIKSLADLLILSSGAVLAAAFVEESIIRGFLQISLEKYQDVTRAVIYASLAWTIIHGMLYWAIQIFLLGIILGLLAWRSDSIFPSVIGHAINNSAALIFYNVDQQIFEGIYLWGDHVSALFLLPAGLGLVYGIKAFYQHYRKLPESPFSPN